MMNTSKLTRSALLAALMLALGYVESLLPAFSSVPGVKLGLANTVLMYALYLIDTKSALALAAIKVVLSAFLYGSPAAVIYSLSGAAVSMTIMLLLIRTGKFSPTGVGIGGALGHNLGQCAAAAAVIGIAPVAAYLPILLISGALTGFVTGTVTALLIKHLRRSK